MRLWSLHPRYPNRQGLTAARRETLLAQAVQHRSNRLPRRDVIRVPEPHPLRYRLTGTIEAWKKC